MSAFYLDLTANLTRSYEELVRDWTDVDAYRYAARDPALPMIFPGEVIVLVDSHGRLDLDAAIAWGDRTAPQILTADGWRPLLRTAPKREADPR